MDHLLRARHLSDEGRYADALDDLRCAFVRRNRLDAEILRAELQEKVGEVEAANATMETVRKIRGLSAAQLSRCEFVLSRVCAHNGDHDSELQHLQRTTL